MPWLFFKCLRERRRLPLFCLRKIRCSVHRCDLDFTATPHLSWFILCLWRSSGHGGQITIHVKADTALLQYRQRLPGTSCSAAWNPSLMDSKTSPQNRISLADPLIAKQVFPLALRVNRLC